MILKPRAIAVEQLPESLNVNEVGAFRANFQMKLITDHPYLVLDCSKVDQMNKSVVGLVLSCLEEAMKRNGDVRLSGVSPAAKAALASVGADRLFHIFPSNADAVSSFHQRSFFGGMLTHSRHDAGVASDKAA